MSTLFVNNISHTNDTTAMTIDTSGRVSRSVIPAFFVYNNTNNWISNVSVGTLIQFNTANTVSAWT